ncbi:UDP-glucosyltransferase 74AE2-like [Rhododendron vialii]|uniref:UDP-glucosyltransferase 74AE2-like n=1 Tax=Rhododendron vialii TaxID=182163 RepID=UPI00265FC8DB|nr:UDP-glucosyltransferase 74AE2-like [Rhododendron vialii]
MTTILSVTKTVSDEPGSITSESIYDDYTEGGFRGPGGYKGFIERLEASGQSCLTELIRNLENSEYPVKVSVMCCHCGIYTMYLDLLEEPPSVTVFSMLGLPEIKIPKLQSIGPHTDCYPPIITQMLDQFSSIDKADWVLFYSFDKLEEEESWMLNSFSKQLEI